MNRPSIKTAIPKKRYKLGEFLIVILGDIESGDNTKYRYILAVVREGDEDPGLYLTVEKQVGSQALSREYAISLIMEDGAEDLGSSTRWGNIDEFASEGLRIVQTVLNLDDEEVRRLM